MCPACHRKLAWWENIPLFSFIALGGDAWFAKIQFPRQYPIVEFSMGTFRRRGVVARQSVAFITPELVRDWALVFVLAFVFCMI